MYKLECGRVYAKDEEVPTGWQVKGPPLREPVPLDVQHIVRYTAIRKLHPRKDKRFRKTLGIPLKGSITMKQMYQLLEAFTGDHEWRTQA